MLVLCIWIEKEGQMRALSGKGSVMTREEYFCKEFVEKIYYFCLKKTGNVQEAEDLSSEIAVEILTALGKGTIPAHFEGWVWTIARNRYARWADRKHKNKQMECDDEEILLSIKAEDNPEEAFVRQEQLHELRRELSLISKEYRQILVAFYIQDEKVSTIAKRLSIPEGTVKTKLLKGRQKLKEGMNMARTFGKLSYAPEEIDIHQSGGKSFNNDPDRFLWDELNSKICRNILLEAYRNPSTMQELSLALGIAMPYLEDYVEEMAKATLMIKKGDKAETATYETNFVIISAESMRKMNDKLASIRKKFVEAAQEYLEKGRELQLAAGIHILGQFQEYEEQKWTLALRLADDIQWSVYGNRNLEFHYDTVRPNGGSWDVMGSQYYEGPEFMWIGHSGDGTGVMNAFVTEEESYSEKDKTVVVHRDNVKIFQSILAGKQEEISEREFENLESAVRKNQEGKYEITFGLSNKAHNAAGMRYGMPVEVYNRELLPLWNTMFEQAEEYIAYCEGVMREEVPNNLMSQFNFCMHSIPFLRGMVVEGLLETGFLKPEEELTDMIGVYMVVD